AINTTGHYAGHPLPHPHLADEKPQVGGKRSGLLSAYPRTKHEETWLRGAWPTNANGIVQFTIFPEWTALPNGMFDTGPLSHVGQFFFDDEVDSVVDKMHPYTTNLLKDRTRNWRDSLNIFEDSHCPEGQYNPRQLGQLVEGLKY
ncbi:hypothetical protein BDZ89DRAFT_1059656, partial [Hymenopellis radicata]